MSNLLTTAAQLSALQADDAITINGKAATFLSLHRMVSTLVFTWAGKATPQHLDYRLALTWGDDEQPELEIRRTR